MQKKSVPLASRGCEYWEHIHEKVRNHLEKENQDTDQPYKYALRVLCEPDNVK